MLAGCGRIHDYTDYQDIVSAGGVDERLFVLREGKVGLHLIINTETGQCSGDAHIELSAPGELFGWAAWMRAERVGISATALGAVAIVALDLARLEDSQIFLKLSTHMLGLLYTRLQEYGICPPNVQALLKFKQLLRVGEP